MRKHISKFTTFVRDIIETIFLALAIFIIVNTLVAQLHQVTGNSMLPDFHHGEYLLTDKLTYKFREPKRGEVIIFKSPEPLHRDYIKRIIALPGEELLIKNGKIIIFNRTHPEGFVLPEPYLSKGTLTEAKKSIPKGVRIQVPPESYIVLGDNREVSSDSRTWGTITKDEIIGRSLIRLWPPSAFSFIARAEYGE